MGIKEFKFKGQTNFYRGKVRDVYTLEDGRLRGNRILNIRAR